MVKIKNNKKNLAVLLLICCFLLAGTNINLNHEKLNHEKETWKEENIIITPNPPLDSAVTIMNDDDLSGYPGGGNFENPHIIEDLIINAGSGINAISISGTTRFFVIRNCTLYNCKNGIYLSQVASGTGNIYNNTIYDCEGIGGGPYEGIGIKIDDSNNTKCYDNHIYNCKGGTGGYSWNGIGIALKSSDNCHVTQNTIHHVRIGSPSTESANGISIRDSDYNLIEENEIYDISNFGSSGCLGISGNGVFIYNGNYNILLNNTIHSTVGSDEGWVGNGIFVDEGFGQANSNQIINNTIYNNTAGNGAYSGNGILVWGYGLRIVRETQIIGNLIYDNTGGTGSFSSNGIVLSLTEDTVITGNTILNCSGNIQSGCGILGDYADTSTISGNTIDNCFGTSNYAGNGIYLRNGNDNIITDNVISNSKGTTGDSAGNGILLYLSDYNTISMNLIVNSSKSGGSDYSGWGIYLDHECDYNDLISNNVGAIDGRGILFTHDYDNNRVMYNNLGSAEIQQKWKYSTVDSSYNEYIGNTASFINVYSGSNNLIEDNTVKEIICDVSNENVIVGNYNSSGGAPKFTYLNGALETNQYFLKITSPEAGKTYRGAGGIKLTYKYQFKGYELSWLRYTLGVDTDQCPRPDGTIYIPWKSGTSQITLYANDTNNPYLGTYSSKTVSFTYDDTSTETPLDITKNEGSDNHALQHLSSSGSGTVYDPYILEYKIIKIPGTSDEGTAGISIQNTDAYFILKDSIIVGGLKNYGIALKNVKNAQFDNVSIIGLPHTYLPDDISEDSDPIVRGFYLDSNCNNNTIMNCNIFRTSLYGIIVEGDNNYICNNIIANAYKYGIDITGDSNTVIYNEIAPFGGPDYDNHYYNKGDTDNFLSGIVIGGSGSNNLIQGNTIRMYPENGIEIDGPSNQNNIIVENEFNKCTTNITDSGTETHFLKINTPSDGAVYTGSTPLTAFGYYSGTEGFQDVEDGAFPSGWSFIGNGIGYLSEVIDEKTDNDSLNHKKILYTYTGEGINPEINMTRDFGQNITSGTIEFWVLRNGEDVGSADFAILGPNGTLFAIMLESGNFTFQDNLFTINTQVGFENNTWYRLSIDFSADGSYAGLGSHQYRFRIYNSSGDALLYESINADYVITNNCSGIQITAQGGPSSNMSIYSDAFGYSWHPGYQIGDNGYEGMLISPVIQLGYKDWTWMGYSLNSNNATELPSFGDVIIPLPNTLGEQTLQLFANDSLDDYQTFSPIIRFTYNFDRKINILSHYENGELAAENTIIKGGLAKLEPVSDLNITITYNTEKPQGSYTYTNASIYYRINQGSWMGPFVSGSIFGTHKFNYILDANNYVLGDTVDYYLKFQQYEVSGKFLQQYFWTQEGLYYFESEARDDPFHKKVSPIPYQLTLIYHVFYEAERTVEIETDYPGYTVTMTGMAPVAMGNFSVDYNNTTPSMTEFNAVFDSNVGGLSHKMYEENSTIFEPASSSITEQDGAMSPFIIPNDLVLIKSVTNISIPVMLFQSNIPGLDNNLVFTGDILNFTYKGIQYDWFYGTKGLKEFELSTGNIHATIRYDALTGIMVYYNYNDDTVNESKSIYFGLYDNNQSYSINLNIEKREELYDTTQDFVNVSLEGILYDPPGDHSYTQMSAGTSITTGYSLETQFGKDIQHEMKNLVCGLGFETVNYKIDTGGEVYEFEMTYTYQQSLTSSIDSDDPDLIGPGGGDLYYGVGTYIIYKFYVNNYYFAVNESDPANYNYNDIRVFTKGSRIEYTFTPNISFSVLGAYLDDLDMSELEDENIFEDNQITGVEGSYIHELQYSPLFWTPSSVQEFGYSSSASEMKGFDSYMEFSNGTYFAWDNYVEFAIGGAVGFGVVTTWETTWKIFETTGKLATLNTWSKDRLDFETVTTEDQILVHLEDDDGTPIGQHDQFKIKMYNDTRYNSIGFIIDTEATYTSGPHEYFTGDRRPPSVCEFVGLDDYLHGAIKLEVIAIDEEINGEEENNIFKVNFYLDDDPNFGTDSIFIGVHGEPDKTSSDDPELFKITWDSSLLNGKYYLFAEAWDYGYPISNSFLSDPVEVQIDNVDPEKCELFIDEPYYGAINFYSKVSDIGSGISYVEYWDGDPDSKDSTLLGSSVDASSSYHFVWVCDPDGDDAGKHKIYAKAFDIAGNSLISKGVEITVQTETENEISNIVSAENSPIIVLVGIIAGACIIYALIRTRRFVRTRRSGSPSRDDDHKLFYALQESRNQILDSKPDNIGKKIEK